MEAYEGLRREAVQPGGQPEYLEGRALLMRRGMAAWARLPSSAPLRSPESHFQSAPVAETHLAGKRSGPVSGQPDSQRSTGGFSACLN
jgi:hypothetical protein